MVDRALFVSMTYNAHTNVGVYLLFLQFFAILLLSVV